MKPPLLGPPLSCANTCYDGAQPGVAYATIPIHATIWRWRKRNLSLIPSMYRSTKQKVVIYIYIYTYISLSLYIYIYIYTYTHIPQWYRTFRIVSTGPCAEAHRRVARLPAGSNDYMILYYSIVFVYYIILYCSIVYYIITLYSSIVLYDVIV